MVVAPVVAGVHPLVVEGVHPQGMEGEEVHFQEEGEGVVHHQGMEVVVVHPIQEGVEGEVALPLVEEVVEVDRSIREEEVVAVDQS